MGITHLSGLEVAGIPTMGMSGLPLTTGSVYFVDYVNGSDGNSGAADQPLQTLYGAHYKMTAGQNDVAVIVGDGSTAATQRLSLANAQVLDPTASAGTLVWSKGHGKTWMGVPGEGSDTTYHEYRINRMDVNA